MSSPPGWKARRYAYSADYNRVTDPDLVEKVQIVRLPDGFRNIALFTSGLEDHLIRPHPPSIG